MEKDTKHPYSFKKIM